MELELKLRTHKWNEQKNGGEDFVNFDNGFWLENDEGGKWRRQRSASKAQDVKKTATNSASYVWRFGMRD